MREREGGDSRGHPVRVGDRSCWLELCIIQILTWAVLHNNNDNNSNADNKACFTYLDVFLLYTPGSRSRLFQCCFQLLRFQHEAGDSVLTLRPPLKNNRPC